MTLTIDQVVGNNIKDIFIVINYKDEVIGEEERVIQHVLDNLKDVQDFSSRIFMVSSKQALLYRRRANGEALKPRAELQCPQTIEETGFPVFETALGTFLNEEKGRAKLQKYAARCHIALKEAERDVAIRQEGLSHSLDDLKERLSIERPKYTKTKREAKRIIDYLQSRLLNGQLEIEQLADASANKIKLEATSAIDTYKGDIDKLSSQEIKELVEAAISPIQKSFLEEINERQEQLIQGQIADAAQKLRKLWKDMEFDVETIPITNSCTDLVTFSGANSSRRKKGISSGDSYLLGSLVGASLALAGIVGGIVVGLGALFFAGVFKDHKEEIKKQVREQYGKALTGFGAKVGTQYKANIEQICMDLQAEIDDRLALMEEQLQRLIDQKEEKSQDVEAVRTKLLQQHDEILRIYGKLQEVIR